MLRIFRGERHAQSVAQPGQHEQDAGTQTGRQSAASGMTTPPQATGGGGSGQATQTFTTPAQPTSTPETAPVPESSPQQTPTEPEPGFLDRGRMRRRARFLRVARELAYRDLGGLVFDLHRFAKRNDEIVGAKLDTLSRIDAELRALEAALRERRPVSVLREAGVAACPRCAAIHGSGDRFCPTCGLSVDQAERPIAAPNAPAAAPLPPPGAAWPPPAPQPLQAWPGVPAVRPPAVEPAAASAAPPIPPSTTTPDAAPASAARPTAAPAPARTRPRAATAPTPANADTDTENGPSRVLDATDPPTEVIRSGLRGAAAPGQQTVAFNPIASPHGGDPQKDGERRQDRP